MIILISRTNLINKIYAVLAILFLGVFFISNLSYAQPEREKEAGDREVGEAAGLEVGGVGAAGREAGDVMEEVCAAL